MTTATEQSVQFEAWKGFEPGPWTELDGQRFKIVAGVREAPEHTGGRAFGIRHRLDRKGDTWAIP